MSYNQTFYLTLLKTKNYEEFLQYGYGVFEKVYTLFAGSAVCMRLKIQKSAFRLLKSSNNSNHSVLVLIQKVESMPSNEISAPFSLIQNYGNKVTLSRPNLGVFTYGSFLLPKLPEATQLWIYTHPSSVAIEIVRQIVNRQAFIISLQRQQIYINVSWLNNKDLLKDYSSDSLLQYRRLVAQNKQQKYTNYLKLNLKGFIGNDEENRYNYCNFIPNKTKLVLQKAQHYDLNEIIKIIKLPKLYQILYEMPSYVALNKQLDQLLEYKPEKKMILFKSSRGLGISSFLHAFAQKNQYNFVRINCNYFASDKELLERIKNSDSYSSTIVYIKNIQWLLEVGNDKNDSQQKMKRILRSLEQAFFNLGDQSLTSHILIVSYHGNSIKLDMTKNANLFKFQPNKQQKLESLKKVLVYCRKQMNMELTDEEEVLNLAVNSLGWVTFFKIMKRLKRVSNSGQKIKTQIMLNQIGKVVSMQKVQNIKNIRWEDVGGLQAAKDEIIQTILMPIKCPEVFDDKIKPRTGLLFFGPPGTGKTMLGKCIANQCKMSFISVKGPELLNMYIGQSEKNVREVFERAAASKPCIVFMDELDALIPKRGQSSDSNQVMDRIVSQLLMQMDKASSNGIFVIGATNRPDLLDPSILRPGRFDKQIYLGITKDEQSRMQILKAQTRHLKLKEGFDYSKVLESVPSNFTGADFYGLTSRSITRAAERFIQQYEKNQQKMKDKEVQISEEDFIETVKTMKPSVSLQQIAHYEKLKQQYK